MIFSFFQKNWVFGYSWSTLLWHRCYYPHRSRDALSPICGIFCKTFHVISLGKIHDVGLYTVFTFEDIFSYDGFSCPSCIGPLQVEAYPFSSFLAEFGGALSLFTGFSFIMLQEALHTLVKRVWSFVK